METLCYEALVQEFESNLLTQLRGHRSTAAFMEMWVPDEDPVRGLLGMFEAADSSGEQHLLVTVTRDTLPEARLGEVRALAAEFGDLSITETPDGYRLLLTYQAAPTSDG
jgi:hypothetical protein